MAKLKMKYGIDLGTTNSAICKMENGEPIIKKTDMQMDILPSCVSFTRRKSLNIGLTGYNDLRQDRARATKTWGKDKQNVFIEFKRTMGLDTHYESSNMGRSYSSEELSAEVLKTLKSFISDDTISAAVVTIPAKFKAPEIAATMRAAKLAGIEACSLLQEPIAASMAYGLSTDNKNGYWLVFDFGGGTFDAALLQVEDGIMQVKDTEGDNYLGGKNLDYAIVDEIIIPYLKENYNVDGILADANKRDILRDAMKYYAEQAKNQLSFKPNVDIMSQLDEFGEDDVGKSLELDMVITAEQLKQVLSPLFQKAIDIVKGLLQRNNLKGTDLSSLILVGGPTYSPILREMLKEQVTPNVDTSIDPMTAVAKGAALYATTQEYDANVKQTTEVRRVTMELGYESTSVQQSEYVIVKLLADESKGVDGKALLFEVTSSDGAWSSGRVALTANGDAVECPLKEGRANFFKVTVFDDTGNTIPCFPEELTIIQGNQVGSATLPYNIGIEVFNKLLGRSVFAPMKGLEKNQSLPAKGVRNGLKVPHDLNPGNDNDKLVIPIYQGEYNSEGSSAIYNDHVFDVIISGDDVPALVSKNSEIDIILKVDNSQGYHMEVLFVSLGETVEKDIVIKSQAVITYSEWLRQFKDAQNKMQKLQHNGFGSELIEVEKKLADLDQRKENERGKPDGMKGMLEDLRRAFLKLEEVETAHEWETLEAELREEYDRLEQANNEFGNKFDEHVHEMHRMVDQAIRSHDVKMARDVKHDCHALFIEAAMPAILSMYVERYNSNFGRLPWRDKMQARQLVDRAIQLDPIADVGELRQLVIHLIDLLPKEALSEFDDLPIIG